MAERNSVNYVLPFLFKLIPARYGAVAFLPTRNVVFQGGADDVLHEKTVDEADVLDFPENVGGDDKCGPRLVGLFPNLGLAGTSGVFVSQFFEILLLFFLNRNFDAGGIFNRRFADDA